MAKKAKKTPKKPAKRKVAKKAKKTRRVIRPIKLVNVTNDPGTALHVLEIEGEAETDSLIRAIGMTEERAKELEGKCIAAFNGVSNIIQVITKISKECTHANELYFVSMVITQIHSRMTNPFGGMQVVMVGKPGGPGGPPMQG